MVKKFGVGILWCIGLGLSLAAGQTNVLLIIADDLGIESLAGFNSSTNVSFAPTPIIDSLQHEGISFNRFYAYSTCSPTRGSIMTGRYSFRTGILSPERGDYELQTNDFTLPEALLASGVISNRLANIGKWHLGTTDDSPNVNGGWPHFSGALGGGLNAYTNWTKTVNGVSTRNYPVYATTGNVNESIDWIADQGTNSWFLWLSFNAPHTPHHRPPDDLHSYPRISQEGSNNSRRHYEAMVEAMDTEMGRLFDEVDFSNTTVIFMGDNGTLGAVAQPPFSDDHCKGYIYEGGIRVPMIVAGAAVEDGYQGTTYDGLIHSVDLYATILELFGVQAAHVVPEELSFDSLSFIDVLRGKPYEREPFEIMALNSFNGADERALVAGDYKYIDFGNGTQEFYNVEADWTETNNLIGQALTAEQESVLTNLQARLVSYINVPALHSSYMAGDAFNIEVGWFVNEGFTLYRAENLVSNDWDEVVDMEIVDNGGAVLALRDLMPPASNAYYRVTSP